MTSPSPNRRRARRRSNGEGTISKRADGRYTAAIFVDRPDGTRGRKWIYGRTRQEVADKLGELSQKVQSGVPVPTRPPTLSAFLQYWMTEVVQPRLRPTTVAKYRSTIDLYIEPVLGRRKIEKITVQMVQQLLNARREAGDSAAKLRMIREVLSSALGRAVREELVVRNVAQLATIPPENRTRRTAWTAAQSRMFLDAARSDPAYPAFVLATVFGMRRGEIAALRWDDVDLDTGRITIDSTLVRVSGRLVRGPTKTAAGRRSLPIVGLVRSALLARQAAQRAQQAEAGDAWVDTGYVFTTASGRPVEPRNLARSFERIVRTAGLPTITFHDLRRSAATLMKDLGIPARDAQVILGHSHVSVTLGIYSEVLDHAITEAGQRLNDVLDAHPDKDPGDAPE